MAIGESISGGLAYKNNKEAQKQQKDAYNDLTARMEASKVVYDEARPEAQRQRAAALQTQLGTLKPLNSMVSEMTGGKYAQDFEAIPKGSPASVAAAGGARPTPSQLGPMYDGGYSPSLILELQAQGYDVSGIPQAAPPKPSTTMKDRMSARRNGGEGEK
jgi:hypothetical protein